MCRNVIIALVLAALSVTSANGSPASPVKTHKSASARAVRGKSHVKMRHRVGQSKRASRAGVKAAPSRSRFSESCLTPARHSRRSTQIRFAIPCKATPLRRVNLVMPAPLFGSRTSLERQNTRTEDDGLERIEDDEDLADRIARKMLVPVPVSAKLEINQNLPADRRYCRPWTASFLTDLARAHGAQFHRPVRVSSAVRTVEFQKRLIETNGNAAAAEGDIVSPHLTGSTVDIAKQGLSRQELAWLRSWLLPMQMVGRIDVEEEFQQTCFHITVYKSYILLPVAQMVGSPKAGRTSSQPHLAGASGKIAGQGL